MRWCWQQNPRQRPSFTQLLRRIQDDMSPAFRRLSFFYSSENQRRGSGEAPDTEADALLVEETPCSPKDPNLGQGQLGDCSHMNGTSCL